MHSLVSPFERSSRMSAAAPGSYLLVTAPGSSGGLPGSVWPGGLAAEGLTSFFAGLDLMPPGIEEGTVVAAAGRKPRTGA